MMTKAIATLAMHSRHARHRRMGVAGLLVVLVGVLILALSAGVAGAAFIPAGPGTFGTAGSGSGEFSVPTSVAVDQLSGDVYVTDAANYRVQKFDSTGHFILMFGDHVDQTKVVEREAQEANNEPVTITEAEENVCAASSGDTCQAGIEGGPGAFSFPLGVAVDNSMGLSAGDVYVADNNRNSIEKFSSEGAYLNEITGTGPAGSITPFGEVKGVATDPAGHVWVRDSESVDEFNGDSANAFIAQFSTGSQVGFPGIAVDASENVYVRLKQNVEKFSSTGSDLGTVDGCNCATGMAVDPSTNELFVGQGTEVAVYSQSGAQESTFGSLTSTEGLAFDPAVTFPGSLPGGLYVVDRGADDVATFSTPTPSTPSVDEESPSSVSATSATLTAQVNPHYAPTSCVFQYVSDASYNASASDPYAAGGTVPCVQETLGESNHDQAASVEIQGLTAETTYHYRVVATNSQGPTSGPDQTFTTQGVNGSGLPDGRQYELVSPPNKEGSLIFSIGEGDEDVHTVDTGDLVQASADGSRVTYLAKAPFAEPQGDGTVEGSQIFSVRGATGWSSQDIETPHEADSRISQRPEYRLFSEDLSLGFAVPQGETPLSPSTPAGHSYRYLRNDETGVFQPLISSTPDLYPAEIRGATPDLSHILFDTFDPSNGSPGPLEEWTNGQSQPVSILPSGVSVQGGSNGGAVASFDGVSADGKHVLWTYEGIIYMRDLSSQRTIVAEYRGSPFLAVNSDGSKIFFGRGGVEGSVYEYNVESAQYTDLSAEESSDGAHLVRIPGGLELVEYPSENGPVAVVVNNKFHHFARVSPGGHYVVFNSTEKLTGYNNLNQGACGGGCTEVYEYDTLLRHLACVSCNPNGAQPSGYSSIPFLTLTGVGQEEGSYFSRVLSPDGRVFFDSTDALVPHDTNGLRDVYEWEPQGVGSCGAANGCMYLISSGTSGSESYFLDASVSGDDVFFLTSDQLVSQDYDHSPDVYDAHVCSSGAPCFASLPVPVPPCVSSDACKAGPTPQPLIFGAPASATFAGAGNPVISSGPPVVKKAVKKPKKPKAKKKAKVKKRSKKHKAGSSRRSNVDIKGRK
jgi:hypothetical protein